MNAISAAARPVPAPTQPDLRAIKTRQQGAWSSGDYAIVGTTLQIVGETLCEALDLRAGQKVLDVAAGNGNITLAAARRWCDVVSTDYVPALLERGRERAAAERLAIEFRQADAEALPFADASFDVVVSTFGVMFTPDQDKAATELLRVCKPGGKIGLANWTPEGFIGQLFKSIGKHMPPPTGVKSPALWGTGERITELFGAQASSIQLEQRDFVFRYRSAQHWVDVFKTYYGPLLKTFGSLEPQAQAALTDDLSRSVAGLLGVIGLFNIVGAIAAGWLSAFMPKRYLLSFIYFARALAILVYITLPPSAAATLIFGAVLGLLWLSTVPPTSGLVTVMFGTHWLATLFGFAFFSHQIGGFLGVWLGGILFERAGSYDAVWWLAILLGLLSAAINLPIVEKPVRRLAAASA